VGSHVPVLVAVDPPYDARGPIADPDVTLLGGGTPAALLAVRGMLVPAGIAGAIVLLVVRGRRRAGRAASATR
jgi:hypothetical protein